MRCVVEQRRRSEGRRDISVNGRQTFNLLESVYVRASYHLIRIGVRYFGMEEEERHRLGHKTLRLMPSGVRGIETRRHRPQMVECRRGVQELGCHTEGPWHIWTQFWDEGARTVREDRHRAGGVIRLSGVVEGHRAVDR